MTLQPLHDESRVFADELERLLGIAERERDVARVKEAVARLARRTFVVAVVGRQRSGKSTLLNALVGEKSPVAPVDVRPTTAALSLVARHEVASATVFLNHEPVTMPGETYEPPPVDEVHRQRLLRHLLFDAPAPVPAFPALQVSREELPRWITHQGHALETSRVVLVRILTNSSRLPQHLVLVDSPGIGALNPRDRELANLIADMADATVMVYSHAANLGREEMAFLVQQLAVKRQREDLGTRPFRRRVFLVQNNWSRPTYTPEDEYARGCATVLEHTRRSIATEWAKRQAASEEFPRGPAPGAQILSLDASHAWASVEHSIEGLFESSGAAALLEALTEFYDNGRALDLWGATPSTLGAVADDFVTDTQARLSALGAEKRVVDQELAKVQRARTQLTTDASGLTSRDLQAALAGAAEAELGRLRDSLKREASKAVEALKDKATLNLEVAVDGAEAALARAVQTAALKLDKTDDEITRKFRALGHQLDRIERDAIEHKTAASGGANVDPGWLNWKGQISAHIDVGGGVARFLYRPFTWFWEKWAVGKQRANFDRALEEALEDLLASAEQRAKATVTRQRASAIKALENRCANLLERLDRLETQLHSDGALKGQELAAKQATLEARIGEATGLRDRIQAHARLVVTRADNDGVTC